MKTKYIILEAAEETLVDRAKRLARAVQESYLDLGEVLYQIKTTKSYMDSKYNKPDDGSWKDWCDVELEGVSYRTAQYWVRIYEYFIIKMGVDRDRLRELGWSKIKELIDFTEDHDLLDQALDVADGATLEEMKGFVSANNKPLGEDTRQTLHTKQFKFYLQEEPALAVDDILKKASLDTNGNLNEAFFKIMVEWDMSNRTYSENPLSIEI